MDNQKKISLESALTMYQERRNAIVQKYADDCVALDREIAELLIAVRPTHDKNYYMLHDFLPGKLVDDTYMVLMKVDHCPKCNHEMYDGNRYTDPMKQLMKAGVRETARLPDEPNLCIDCWRERLKSTFTCYLCSQRFLVEEQVKSPALRVVTDMGICKDCYGTRTIQELTEAVEASHE